MFKHKKMVEKQILQMKCLNEVIFDKINQIESLEDELDVLSSKIREIHNNYPYLCEYEALNKYFDDLKLKIKLLEENVSSKEQ